MFLFEIDPHDPAVITTTDHIASSNTTSMLHLFILSLCKIILKEVLNIVITAPPQLFSVALLCHLFFRRQTPAQVAAFVHWLYRSTIISLEATILLHHQAEHPPVLMVLKYLFIVVVKLTIFWVLHQLEFDVDRI
jgi:hypothetical protein